MREGGTTITGTALEVASPQEIQELQARQEAEFDSDLFSTPILKIGQALTKEVAEGNAEKGEFINTLTGEGLGDKLEFIVSYYQKGRFAVDRKTNRAFVAFGGLIPQAWEDLVGAEFVDTPFSEYPDAEETYKQRVNNKEIEWGKGPLVSTTHNFTGLIVVEPLAGSDDEAELQPVRLSLQRTNVPAAKKWATLLKSLRNKSFWDRAFDLGTYNKEFATGSAYLLNVRLGRETNADEKAQAVELAQAVAAGRVEDNSAEAAIDAPTAPKAEGALDV